VNGNSSSGRQQLISKAKSKLEDNSSSGIQQLISKAKAGRQQLIWNTTAHHQLISKAKAGRQQLIWNTTDHLKEAHLEYKAHLAKSKLEDNSSSGIQQLLSKAKSKLEDNSSSGRQQLISKAKAKLNWKTKAKKTAAHLEYKSSWNTTAHLKGKS
ncbi:hypothetical protein CDAR_616361, partial [Caerostris darwini]